MGCSSKSRHEEQREMNLYLPKRNRPLGPLIRLMPSIRAPLPDITMHLIQAKPIGVGKIIHWDRARMMSIVIGLVGGNLVGVPVKRGVGSGAASVFPFRFGRQAPALSTYVIEPISIGVGVMPTDVDHRPSFLPPIFIK